jgi:hypothetical protein
MSPSPLGLLTVVPVRQMSVGIPGGSATNVAYAVLCGGGLTAAVVYVSTDSRSVVCVYLMLKDKAWAVHADPRSDLCLKGTIHSELYSTICVSR